jgi:hypothetical protein
MLEISTCGWKEIPDLFIAANVAGQDDDGVIAGPVPQLITQLIHCVTGFPLKHSMGIAPK